MLRLRTLGSTALFQDDVQLSGTAVQKRRLALLAALAIAGDRGVSREKLAAWLWPESDEEQARHSLSQWIYTTRRELKADDLFLGTTELRFNPERIGSDVADFERAAAAGALEEAIAAYGGPFLDGFHVAGAVEFEHWADGERDRLSRLHQDTLEKLARLRESTGDHGGAADAWRKLAACDPFNGRVALALMRALATSGDVAGALTHARVHATLLKQELGAEPQRDVLAYAEELRVAPPRVRPHVPVTTAAASPDTPRAPQAATPGIMSRGRRRRRLVRRAALAAGLLVVLGTTAAFWAMPRNLRAVVRTLVERPDARLVSRRIVVAPFENRTGDSTLDVFGEMAAEVLAGALAETGELEVVDARAAVVADRVLDRIPWPFRPGNRLVAMAGETQAAYVVSGSYYRDGRSLRVVAQVTDVASGKVTHAPVSVTGSVSAPWALVDSITARALPMAVAVVDTAWSGATIGVTSPPSVEAYREMRAAWEAYFESNIPEAIARARRAAAMDTSFMAPLALEAHLRAEDRDWARVDSLVTVIQRHGPRLSALERSVAAMYASAVHGDLAGQLAGALDVVRYTPASPETRTYAARVAVNANRPGVALKVTETVDPRRGVMLAQPWYWNWTTAAYHELGRYDLEFQNAEEGAKQFPMSASALTNLGRAQAVRGDREALRRLLDRLPGPHSTFSQPRWKVAFDWTRELRAHGHPAESRELLEVLLAQLTTAPDDSAHWRDRFTAVALGDLGRWGEARERWQQLATRQPANLDAQGYLAMALSHTGDAAGARRIESALEHWPDHYAMGRHTLWRARIAVALGELDRGAALVEEALSQGHPRFFDQAGGRFDEPELHADPALLELRKLPSFQALLAPRS